MEETDKAKLKRELRRMHRKKSGPKHNVNFHLMLLIVILLVALIGATFYFFWRYDSLIDENKEFIQTKSVMEDQITQCSMELSSAIDQMNSMAGELNLSASTREELNLLYVNLSNVRSQLESDLSNAQTSLSTCNFELQKSQDTLSIVQKDLDDAEDAYQAAYDELQKKKSELSETRDERDECLKEKRWCTSDLEDIEQCVDDENCTACQ